ncbi:MAG: S-layer homology domain-containing protein [bacterium]|nr:S-layer homology domain-containing protein [bacterium]
MRPAGRRRRRGFRSLVVLLAAVLLVVPSVAGAAEDEGTVYDDDPLGLIAAYNITTFFSLDRDDLWDVWICEVPEGTLEFSPEAAVTRFEDEIAPYYDWLSGGRYRPVFRVGGTIEATAFDNWGGCNSPVYEASLGMREEDRPEGVLIIVNMVTTASFGSFGAIGFPSPVEVKIDYGATVTYPNNPRTVQLGGQVLAEPGSLPPTHFVLGPLPKISTVAHEMGHGIGFPHSYRTSDYDNPMDVMSNTDAVAGLQVGTVAINRYAAGWIDPEEVRIHSGGRAVYRLHPIGEEGTQMLVLRSDSSSFMTLGARVRKGYDTGIPVEGVESYLIDQQPDDCFRYPDYQACFATERPTRLFADVGAGYTWEGMAVNILRRVGDSFLVEVSEHTEAEESDNRFVDDDGNTHEENIEIVAALGITLGCNPPDNDRFCPRRPVTRAQMSAFLGRALGESGDDAPAASRFTDIPDGAWYLGYVESLADLGVFPEQAGSPFRPTDPLTRLEMAVWMAGAFESITEVEPQGVFTDVAADAWYAAAVEGLRAAGVTKGCKADPLSYCPYDDVSRDQMASFLARVLVTS